MGFCRFVATELQSDLVVEVGDMSFHLHKVHSSPLNSSCTKPAAKPNIESCEHGSACGSHSRGLEVLGSGS